jgi:hypothetical protein
MPAPIDVDDEEDDRNEDARPRRRPKAAPDGWLTAARAFAAVSIVPWLLLFAAVGVGGLLFISALGSAKNGVQEAALGAVFSTAFIGLYVLARCVEKVLAAAERMRAK